ncbi:MAG: hypothetical protein NUW22_12515 [Acidobacteria bacterium]|nr:hypothetical protein [Acidobacteriota bacterium]
MDWNKLMETAVMTLGPLVILLAAEGLRRLMKKWGIEADQAKLDRALGIGKLAIQFATEMRADAEKRGRKLTAKETLAIAVDFVLRNNPSTTQQKALDMIHALLPESSEGAASSQVDVSVPFGQAAQ